MTRGKWAVVILFVVFITSGLTYLNSLPVKDAAAPEDVYVEVIDGSVELYNRKGKVDLKADGRALSQSGEAPKVFSTVKPTPIKAPRQSPQVIAFAVNVINDVSQPVKGANVLVREGSTVIASASSDEVGAATFSLSLSGDAFVSAQQKEHFDSKPISVFGKEKLILNVDRKLAIHGKVVDQNQNEVMDAVVSISGASTVQSSTSTPFLFSSLHPGTYRVQASHATLLGDEQIVQAGDEIVLHLATSATVIASVSTMRGEPVGGAVLDMVSKRGAGFIFLENQKTNVKGIANFSDIKRGTYSIGIKHPWYQSLERTDVLVDSVTEEISIVLPDKNHSISGHVFDAATNEPIANAPMVCGLDWGSEDSFFAMKRGEKHTGPLSATHTVYTNEDGFYRFDDLWSGLYIIFVDKVEEYISGNSSLIENSGAQKLKRVLLSQDEAVESVDFYLKQCWKISGHVFDPDGEPLANVNVRARLSYANPAEGRYRTGRLEKFGMECMTDASGYYEISGSIELLSDGSMIGLFVDGWHDKYGLARSKDKFYLNPGESKEGVDIHFTNCAIVQGMVCDEDNNPISGAKVLIWREPNGKLSRDEARRLKVEYEDWWNLWNRVALTDEKGFYQFHLTNQTGDHFIRAHAEGYLNSAMNYPDKQITLEPGADSLICDFTLKQGMPESLEGVVVNEDNQPLEGVLLRIYPEASMGISYHVMPDTYKISDRQGRFCFDLGMYDRSWTSYMSDRKMTEPPPGSSYSTKPFQLIVHETDEYEYTGNDKYHENVLVHSPVNYDWGEKNIRIVMTRKKEVGLVSFRGRVLDSNGQPLVNYDIVVVPGFAPNVYDQGSMYYRWSPVHSNDGSFFLENIPAEQGQFRIAVRSEEHGFSSTGLLNPQTNEIMEDIVIQVGQGAMLSGVVRDRETGEPVADADVYTILPPSPLQQQQLNSRLGRVSGVPRAQSQIAGDLTSAKTNQQGEYELHNVCIPTIQLRIIKREYNDFYLPVMELQHDEMRNLDDVNLTPKELP
jgi:protocatechuate 3,4-dioxygenase beta subunit